MAVDLRRLWQPRSGLFWQMVAYNLLSSGCAWALRALPLNGTAFALVALLGLLNAGFGMLAAWRLATGPAAPPAQASPASTPSTSD